MAISKYAAYLDATLETFAEKLQTDYYSAIGALCEQVKKQAVKIKKIEKSESSLQYVLSCENIVSEIERHINGRKDIYIPYVHTLSEKVKHNHNCSNCSGSCKINHDVHILELNVTNDEMKKVVARLQMITLPLYSESLFPDEYRVLRSNMTLLETNLSELFFLENTYLIPKIAEAQKSINAGNR